MYTMRVIKYTMRVYSISHSHSSDITLVIWPLKLAEALSFISDFFKLWKYPGTILRTVGEENSIQLTSTEVMIVLSNSIIDVGVEYLSPDITFTTVKSLI